MVSLNRLMFIRLRYLCNRDTLLARSLHISICKADYCRAAPFLRTEPRARGPRESSKDRHFHESKSRPEVRKGDKGVRQSKRNSLVKGGRLERGRILAHGLPELEQIIRYFEGKRKDRAIGDKPPL